MIVTCTRCQAKFRVADDNVGPRGAKVRCSRCQTVFVVEPASAAPDPVPASEPSRAALPVTDPSERAGATGPGRGRAVPPPLPPPLPQRAPAAAPAPATDPFAAAVAPPRDADPFELAAPAPAPVTAAGRPPVPSAAPDDGGLALEDRLTPPPMKVPAPDPLGLAGSPAGHPFGANDGDPFGAAQPFDPGAFYLSGDPAEPSPELARAGGEAEPGIARTTTDAPDEEPAPAEPPAAPRSAAAAAPAPAQERIPGRRWSRLRAAAVNAVALATLLLVALAMLVAWRTDGPIDARSLRPAAVLGLLRPGAAVQGPFVASDVRSGVYERAHGAPLVFVRGKAVSRAPRAVPALRVSVELVRAGEVLARGAAIAGAVPTPEELHSAADDAALARAAEAARRRAPAEVRPGDAVPFLVAIAGAPEDLDAASVRLEIAPAR